MSFVHDKSFFLDIKRVFCDPAVDFETPKSFSNNLFRLVTFLLVIYNTERNETPESCIAWNRTNTPALESINVLDINTSAQNKFV